mmetsp:Transcript_112111/g.312046  ORF Transcript_112111/g.312046 Transcript_112111/m.312046 type:complete len:263 (-) Transcript_112111:1072-1860(-)
MRRRVCALLRGRSTAAHREVARRGLRGLLPQGRRRTRRVPVFPARRLHGGLLGLPPGAACRAVDCAPQSWDLRGIGDCPQLQEVRLRWRERLFRLVGTARGAAAFVPEALQCVREQHRRREGTLRLDPRGALRREAGGAIRCPCLGREAGGTIRGPCLYMDLTQGLLRGLARTRQIRGVEDGPGFEELQGGRRPGRGRAGGEGRPPRGHLGQRPVADQRAGALRHHARAAPGELGRRLGMGIHTDLHDVLSRLRVEAHDALA